MDSSRPRCPLSALPMNVRSRPIGRTQIDPFLPVKLLRSGPAPGPTSFGFNVSEAAVRGH